MIYSFIFHGSEGHRPECLLHTLFQDVLCFEVFICQMSIEICMMIVTWTYTSWRFQMTLTSFTWFIGQCYFGVCICIWIIYWKQMIICTWWMVWLKDLYVRLEDLNLSWLFVFHLLWPGFVITFVKVCVYFRISFYLQKSYLGIFSVMVSLMCIPWNTYLIRRLHNN